MDPRTEVQGMLRTQWILWGALSSFPLIVLAGMLLAAKVELPPEQRLPFAGVAAALVLVSVGLSFVLPRRIRPEGVTEPRQRVMSAFILANALCEAAGIMAAVGFALTRFTPLLVGLAIAATAAFAHRPSAERNEELLRAFAREKAA